MGKSKMDEAAAERIRRARGEKDGFSKRATDAARRNQGGDGQGDPSSSSNGNGGSGGDQGKGDQKSK